MVVFELSLSEMDYHKICFELYSVNKQINEIMNRRRNNPQSKNEKLRQPFTGNVNYRSPINTSSKIKTPNHPN